MSFHGIIPAVTTPFDSEDRVDAEALGRNIEHLVEAGVHGIVGTGTMGESGSLSREERREVLETIVGAADGRVPVVAGIAATTPAIATAYIADAKAAGVAGFMVLPPLLYDGGYAEIAAYFKAVCAAAELPVVAYNNPHAAGYDLPAEVLIRLAADLEEVVQVKECSGDVRRIPAIIDGSDGELGVLVGGDDWSYEGLCVGAAGWISGVADVLAAECVRLYDLIAARELDEARRLYARLLPMARFDMTPKLVQYYKAGMDEVGLAGGSSRPPRLALEPAEHEELLAALALVREPAGA
jgi:dihydrodipicolinate synthase/N-acetylneuraminate lyase